MPSALSIQLTQLLLIVAMGANVYPLHFAHPGTLKVYMTLQPPVILVQTPPVYVASPKNHLVSDFKSDFNAKYVRTYYLPTLNSNKLEIVIINNRTHLQFLGFQGFS